MKTAKDYLNDIFCEVFESESERLTDEEMDVLMQGQDDEAKLLRSFVSKLNEARKDTIELCAERVETVNTSTNPYETYYEVDKKSILSLINEIK